MRNDLLEKVYFRASLKGMGLSTWVNSGRSLTFNVVEMINKAAAIATTTMANCKGRKSGVVPALGRNRFV